MPTDGNSSAEAEEKRKEHGCLAILGAGHSLGNCIKSEFVKSVKENLSWRLKEAEKVGTGSAVPAPTCSKRFGAQAVAVAA
jgi:hypothetical protein